MREERYVIAHHEGGHAAMAWLCGFDTRFVDIHQTDDRKGGVELVFTEEQKILLLTRDVDMIRRRIFVCCAGAAADYHHAGKHDPEALVEGFNGDRSTALALMAHIDEGGDEHFYKYVIFVMRLFDRFGWDIVDEVAAILIARGELSSEEMTTFQARKGTLPPEATAMANNL